MQRNLKKHTVRSFDNNFKDILTLVSKMSELTLESIDIVDDAIQNGDEDLVSKIRSHDKIINQYNDEIDSEITAFIALRQPKGYDLRFIISIVKVSSNLERVGDYAKKAIKQIIKSSVLPSRSDLLLKMTKIARTMIIDAVDSVVNNDIEKAQEVLSSDDKIDDLYKEIFAEFKNKTLNEDSRELINIVFITKAIERLADHAVNIASAVDYIVTGEMN